MRVYEQGHVIKGDGGREYRVFAHARGGMGAVYFCDVANGAAQVAIKVPHALGAIARDLFRREAMIWLELGDVSDSFLTPLLRIENVGGIPGLVMPYFPAGSIRDSTGGGVPRLGPHLIISQVILGLKQLATAGIVHRDLKPENVLLAEKQVSLTDLGIASSELRDNRPIINAGTLPYMSPEQLNGLGIEDGSSDLWALGVLSYELLTGIHPFRAADAKAMVQRIKKGIQPGQLDQVTEEIPDPIRLFLLSGLAANRQDRFATLDEAAVAWDRAVAIRHPDDASNSAIGGSESVVIVDAKTSSYWWGLFFPERFAEHGLKLVSVKYTAAVSLRTAENLYSLGDYRAAIEELRGAFGHPDVHESPWATWMPTSSPPIQERRQIEPFRVELQSGAKEVEAAVQCVLRCWVAILEEDPEAHERDEAQTLAQRISIAPRSSRRTKELSAQVLVYTRAHDRARDVLLELLEEDESDPRVWHVHGLNQALSQSPADELREVANRAEMAKLAGALTNYTRAYLWALAGDFRSSVPHARKAVSDDRLSYTLMAELVGFLWNGDSRAEAMALLDELDRAAADLPKVMRLKETLGSRLAQWRRGEL